MKYIIILTGSLLAFGMAMAQPQPGDLFREYAWHNKAGDCNGALRVGGRLDYQLVENVIDYRGNGIIPNPPIFPGPNRITPTILMP